MCPQCSSALKHTLKCHRSNMASGRSTDEELSLEETCPPMPAYKRLKGDADSFSPDS